MSWLPGGQTALRDRSSIDQKLDLDRFAIGSLGNLDLESHRKAAEGDRARIETQFTGFRGPAPIRAQEKQAKSGKRYPQRSSSPALR